MSNEKSIQQRIRNLDNSIELAAQEKAKAAGALERLDEEKVQILSQFTELGVEPSKAKATIEELEAEVLGHLEEAERVVAEYDAA